MTFAKETASPPLLTTLPRILPPAGAAGAAGAPACANAEATQKNVAAKTASAKPKLLQRMDMIRDPSCSTGLGNMTRENAVPCPPRRASVKRFRHTSRLLSDAYQPRGRGGAPGGIKPQQSGMVAAGVGHVIEGQ